MNLAFYGFHDTELSHIVENAYQAIALDEHRANYDITLWNSKEKPDQTIEQRWFVLADADVGGGYPDRRLSDIAPLMDAGSAPSGLGLLLSPVDVGADNVRGTP